MLVKAKLKFTHIQKPDDNNKYSTAFFCLDKEQEKELIAAINADWKANKGTYSKAPKSLGYNEYKNEENDQDEDNGKIIFRASQNAQSADGKYTFKVSVYDSKAKLIPEEQVPSIGWGTIADLSVSTYCWTYQSSKGIKLNLEAVQILDLVEYNGGNPFTEAEEGEFVATTNTFEVKNTPKVKGL